MVAVGRVWGTPRDLRCSGVVQIVTQTPRGADVTVTGRDACNLEALRTGVTDLMIQSGLTNLDVAVRQAESLERGWSGKLRTFVPLASIRP